MDQRISISPQGLFAAALPAEVMITVLYWILEFDGNIDYLSIMTHGGCMGLIVSMVSFRIPIRTKQFHMFQTFSILYLLWSTIHAFSNTGNPYNNGVVQTDDAIYGSLAWKKRRRQCGNTF
ncbi:LOW QUALITY PROTEIN: hypothetical protein ACHAWF_000415, partial [Thalassiosira exigua]